MNTDIHAATADHHHDDHSHGSLSTYLLGFVLSVIFYLSPILYPVAGRFERFFIWNPMTPLLGLFRSALLSSAIPGAGSLVFLVAVAAAVFAGGLMFFRRAQPTLADLI